MGKKGQNHRCEVFQQLDEVVVTQGMENIGERDTGGLEL